MSVPSLLSIFGNSGGKEPPYVEDVFSTYLYKGNGGTQTITNGINLAGKGGLTWVKQRNESRGHNLCDTERGATKILNSSNTGAEGTYSTTITVLQALDFLSEVIVVLIPQLVLTSPGHSAKRLVF